MNKLRSNAYNRYYNDDLDNDYTDDSPPEPERGFWETLFYWCENWLNRTGRQLMILIPYIWLVLFFLIPCFIVLKISLASTEFTLPPYTNLVSWTNDAIMSIKLNFNHYKILFTDNLYVISFLNSVGLSIIATTVCLIIGYPMAYAIIQTSPKWRYVLMLLVILPFWTSFLLRIYAWITLLSPQGVINNILISWHIIDYPLLLINTKFAVCIGIVYSYLPFMTLPLCAVLDKMDYSLIEAAYDLGSRPMRTFFLITLPLSWRGILSGSILVFISALGEFVIPELLGGDLLMIGKILWSEFFNNLNWPLAASIAILLLGIVIIPVISLQKLQTADTEDDR